MIDNEHTRAWIDALESGIYHRTENQIRFGFGECGTRDDTVPGFCCLGVLCDLEQANDKRFIWRGNELYRTEWLADRSVYYGYYAPPEFMELVGMTEVESKELSDYNDSGWSFRMIAQRIREMAGIQ